MDFALQDGKVKSILYCMMLFTCCWAVVLYVTILQYGMSFSSWADFLVRTGQLNLISHEPSEILNITRDISVFKFQYKTIRILYDNLHIQSFDPSAHAQAGNILSKCNACVLDDVVQVPL